MSSHFSSLLPANSTRTPLVLALEQAMLPTGTDVAALKNIRSHPPESYLPYLVWEYGLTQIAPFLPSYAITLSEGIQWQLERGTESAVIRALSWLNPDATAKYEEGISVRWTDIQIDPGYIPSTAQIDNLIYLFRLSTRAASRLVRLHHGYDVRRAVFSESALGAGLWGDYSGVFHTDGFTKVSFGINESIVIGEDSHQADGVITTGVCVLVSETNRWAYGTARFGDVYSEERLSIAESSNFSCYADDNDGRWPGCRWMDVTWDKMIMPVLFNQREID